MNIFETVLVYLSLALAIGFLGDLTPIWPSQQSVKKSGLGPRSLMFRTDYLVVCVGYRSTLNPMIGSQTDQGAPIIFKHVCHLWGRLYHSFFDEDNSNQSEKAYRKSTRNWKASVNILAIEANVTCC